MLLVMWAAVYGWTQELSSADALVSFRSSYTSAMSADQKAAVEALSKQRGVNASDAIVGNGTRAGYVLSHSAVVPGSEIVTVDGTSKRSNRDYYLDYLNGTLMFLEPVKTSQMVRVTYRYVPGKEGERAIVGAPTMSLNLGQKNAMGITYGYRTGLSVGQNSQFDMLTFGANLKTTLGEASSMTNMFYTSSAKQSGRISLQAVQDGQKQAAEAPKSDRMFVHSADLTFGNLSVKTDFQKVGEHFAGFASLRDQGVAAADVLNKLEKEKGITRLGVNASLKLGGGITTGIGFNTIEDKGGDIVRQSFDISSDRFKLNARIQEVEAGFTKFGNLADGDKDQLAKEKGIKRTNYQLSMAPGKGSAKDAAWNGLGWGEIADASGKISFQSLNFAGSNFGLMASQSKVDEGFKRLGSLSAADLGDIALRIRREFDPNAATASVTKEDLEHAARETGIERRNIAGNLKLGSGTVSMQMVDVGDGSSGVSRQTVGYKGKNFSISGLFQQIDEDFEKLGILSPIERAHLGNERGMDRMNLNGSLNLKPGLSIASSFARVGDDKGDVVKYGLSVKGAKFDLRANYQDIDPEFTRVMDLADADREAMNAEQGMKRYDTTLNYRFNKALSLQSFWYDAQHSTQDKFRRQLRNQIDYNPANGPQITLFRYQDQAGASDANTTFLHEMYKLTHKLNISAIGPIEFRGLVDTKTKTEVDGVEKQTRVRNFHINNDQKQKVRFTGDINSIEREDDTFEKVQVFTLGTNLTPTLAFSGMRKTIDTQNDQTIVQDYGITGKVFGGYALSARFGETLLDGKTIGKVRELSLTPPAAKDYGVFKAVNWNLKFAELRSRDKIETRTKQASVESTVLKHKVALAYSGLITKEGHTPIVRSFSILGDPDPKKKLHYSLSYKVIDPGKARSTLVRNYTAEYKLNAASTLNYLYTSYNEQDGKLVPASIERLTLNTKLTRTLGLVTKWENNEDLQNSVDRTLYSLGISGKLGALAAVEVSYGYDKVVTRNGKSVGHTYKVKYDRTVSTDHFLTFSGTYTDWEGPKPANANADDLTLQVDFNLLFD